MTSANVEYAATFEIKGEVDAPDFPNWIETHAQRLGLRAVEIRNFPKRLNIIAVGPQEMLEALALGCSLGPASVLVDEVEFALGAAA